MSNDRPTPSARTYVFAFVDSETFVILPKEVAKHRATVLATRRSASTFVELWNVLNEGERKFLISHYESDGDEVPLATAPLSSVSLPELEDGWPNDLGTLQEDELPEGFLDRFAVQSATHPLDRASRLQPPILRDVVAALRAEGNTCEHDPHLIQAAVWFDDELDPAHADRLAAEMAPFLPDGDPV